MKRLLNVRIPVLLACSLIAGIALGYAFAYYGLDLIWLIAVIPLTGIAIILCAIFVKRISVTIIILISVLCFSAGAVNCFFRLENYSYSEIDDGSYYTVTAKVDEKGINSYGEYLILSDLRFNGVKCGGKCFAYLSDTYGEFCDIGYTVSFEAAVSSYDAFPYGKLNYKAEDNIKYVCTVRADLTSKYNFSFFGSIRSAVRDVLFDNLSYQTAAVEYAMLTGNTQSIDEDSMSIFRYGGIAHIFAVSGLHIGIVFAVVSFITKKLPINKYVSAIVCCGIIFLYSGICGFTVSSVRAAVMCTVSVIAKLIYRKYDGLNSLSFAAIIILLITPLSLFSAGFQLSVGAVTGIFILSGNFTKIFKKIPLKIGQHIGVSLSAQATVYPVLLVNFGYLSGVGLLLNIVLIPIFSVLYVILFASVAVSAIFPVCAPLLVANSALPLELLLSFLLNAGFEKALLTGFGAGAFIPLYYLILFLLSDKLNVKILKRLIAAGCALILLVTYTLVRIYAPTNAYKLYAFANTGGGAVLISSGGESILIVTENFNPYNLGSELNNRYVSDISAVIIIGSESCADLYGSLGINCGDVYLCGDIIPIQAYRGVTLHYEREFELNGINFSFADSYSVLCECNGVTVGITSSKYPTFESCGLLFSLYPAPDCDCGQKIYFNGNGGDYNIYDSGGAEYILRNGGYKSIGLPKRQ